jgi:Tn3 transposase DDE domain-containing protein
VISPDATEVRLLLGEPGDVVGVRARDPETVQRQFESRRLMANLVVYWNARYMALAFSQLDRLGWCRAPRCLTT